MSKQHVHTWIRENRPGKPNVEVCSGCGLERSVAEAREAGPVPAPLPPPAPKPRPSRKRAAAKK